MIVYLITNILNGKRYVGQTTRTLAQRIKEHQLQHSAVGDAINQCGIENFRFEILETCDTIDQLNEREKFWISKLNCIASNGYNRNEGGRNFIRQHRDHSVAPISLANKMTICESLKRFRKDFHLTQKQVADTLGISQPNYQWYESKNPPSSDVIVKIALAYNVSADYLLGLTDNPRPYENLNVDPVMLEGTPISEELPDAIIAVTDDADEKSAALLKNYHKALRSVLAKQGIEI